MFADIQQHAGSDAGKEQRGAAATDEGQRLAGGGQEPAVDADVYQALTTEPETDTYCQEHSEGAFGTFGDEYGSVKQDEVTNQDKQTC